MDETMNAIVTTAHRVQPDLVQRGANSVEESITVIFKLPQASDGLANLPWHRDCGMGGHSVMCPILVASATPSPLE